MLHPVLLLAVLSINTELAIQTRGLKSNFIISGYAASSQANRITSLITSVTTA